jgi:hypothetical protein
MEQLAMQATKTTIRHNQRVIAGAQALGQLARKQIDIVAVVTTSSQPR